MKKTLKLNSKSEGCENKKEANKRNKLKSRYNISLEFYDIMLKKQKNTCKICGIDSCKTGRAFSVDHCHTTNKIRGLLCSNCNAALGFMSDDTARMKRAIQYLKPPWYVKIREHYATFSNRFRN